MRMHLLFWLFAFTSTAAAQTSEPAPGHRLFGTGKETWLVDANGAIVQTWTSDYEPGVGVYLHTDGTLYRTIRTRAPWAGGGGGGLQRLTLDGTVLWEFRYDGPGFLTHHDIEILPNGNVLMIAWEEISFREAVQAGKDPDQVGTLPFLPDKIIEVRPTGPTSGEIVWEWRVWDHLIQDFDPTKDNYGNVANHPELIDINYPRVQVRRDWNHMNSVKYHAARDWIILNPREQSEYWIIDHSTTTEEAATGQGGRSGRGGDIIYRWGNPEAYRAGTPADRQLRGHHAPHIIPEGRPGAGNILVFNNQAILGTSVWEVAVPDDINGKFSFGEDGRYGPAGPLWSYSNDPAFRALFVSNAERLPNGNTLICSGAQGWIFEVGADDRIVWEYRVPSGVVFHAHYYEHYLWADNRTISVTQGGEVNFDIVAGTQHAGRNYWLFGTMSGINPGFDVFGHHVPLNIDEYMLITIGFANSLPFIDNEGIIGPDGRGHATFRVPGGIPTSLIGLTLHHAYAVFGPDVELTSHAIPLGFGR